MGTATIFQVEMDQCQDQRLFIGGKIYLSFWATFSLWTEQCRSCYVKSKPVFDEKPAVNPGASCCETVGKTTEAVNGMKCLTDYSQSSLCCFTTFQQSAIKWNEYSVNMN